MQEQVAHKFHVEADRASVWDFFWDIPGMAMCIPGCESVTEHEPKRTYTAQVKKKMGPFLIRMPLDIRVIESEDLQRMRVQVTGKDNRLRSEVQQSIEVSLADAQGTGTDVLLDMELTLRGTLAMVGKPIVKTQINHTLDGFTRQLRSAIAARAAH
jgi:carbon monoxide dehydrogenase subunit G